MPNPPPRVHRHLRKSELFATLPPVWPEDLRPRIRRQVRASGKKLVVLDDDPTGTQTVYDIPVLTCWELDTLAAELDGDSPAFYLLTNTRGRSAQAARDLNLEIARNLRNAAAATGRSFDIVSRSDSTLRGHYPIETDALDEGLGPFDATLLIPYFEAGGRYTIGGVHYVAEDDELVPAAETPFAADTVFGFTQSALADYVEEKTAGRIPAAAVFSIELADLRRHGPDAVRDQLLDLAPGLTGFVNAAAPRDLEVLVAAVIEAEAAGRHYLFRTAAQFVAARLGLEPRPLWRPTHPDPCDQRTGGLTVVGSHVPKTTTQLQELLRLDALTSFELLVPALLDPRTREPHLHQVQHQVRRHLADGRDVVVHTSRERIVPPDAEDSIALSQTVSRSLVALVRMLDTRPRYLVAKGGITSSDVATRGLGVRRALVLGQILPGIPVWELGPETRFPGLPYVVFPGNVGGPEALREAVTLLRAAG
jgi:uncharacterized protein YgbK (DUF1537 family)